MRKVRLQKMDKVILGEGCYLEEDLGMSIPNNNQIVVGCSGTGKSMSVMLPTMLHQNESSFIATYAKAGEARKLAHYFAHKKYKVHICDLSAPEKSTISFEPLKYVSSYLDIEELATQIVVGNPQENAPKDKYWNDSAKCLLMSLIMTVLMMDEKSSFLKVMDLFNELKIWEDGRGIATSLDELYKKIKEKDPDSQAVCYFTDFQMLPYATAGCVRDTLAKSLRRMFPEPVQEIMKRKRNIDFKKLATEKTALIIITSAVNTSLYYFANLIFATGIKQFLEYSETCDNQKLPRPVRLYFDDFACGAPIQNYPKMISIFRAANISALMLIQSESQLNELYTNQGATTILNNCSSYTYFSGGMDLETCQNISRRVNEKSVSDIMYMPTGKVIVMRSGKKPVVVPRFDIYNSDIYREYENALHEKENRKNERYRA